MRRTVDGRPGENKPCYLFLAEEIVAETLIRTRRRV
jgi:hypothetical protein